MFFKLQPIIYSVIFILALETLAYKQNWFFGVLFFLIGFSILIIWPLARKIRYLSFPVFLSLGSISLLFFIDTLIEEQIFIAMSGGVYYLALLGSYRLKFYSCDRTAQGMLNLVTIASMFFWLLAIHAWFLNFAIDFWILPVVILGSTASISIPSLIVCSTDRENIENKIKKRNKKQEYLGNQVLEIIYRKNRISIILLDLILALAVAQFAWAVSFWPFSYLTSGTVVLIIFYVFWDSIRNLIQGSLSSRRLIANSILATVFVLVMLLTAQWDLIV